MREIDQFSRVVGSMSTFNEMLACGAKNVALGHPVDDEKLRDEHMEHALVICRERGTQCCKEDDGFLTDLFPAAMNRNKYNILFYRDPKYRDEYFALKKRKKQLVEVGQYNARERYRLAYDYGKLLSYSDEAIERMIAQNKDREVFENKGLDVHGHISFLYFDDLDAACEFFSETLGLTLACDQGWSKIYRICPGAFVGAVDRSRGACKATTRDGVLTSLVVLNFDEMHEKLSARGIVFERPPRYSEALKIKSMMFVGPEGYKFEVEEFMDPETRKVFYGKN
jgi:hypothetical protein